MSKKLSVSLDKFNFRNVVKTLYGNDIKTSTLKEAYNFNPKTGRGKSTKETGEKGVYALYNDDKLMKIGQAAYENGIFHRVSQYYRGKDGKCEYITDDNKNLIEIEYVNFNTAEECWAAEKLLQGIAYYMGEEMPWEKKRRKD